jgi:hypothetical protein
MVRLIAGMAGNDKILEIAMIFEWILRVMVDAETAAWNAQDAEALVDFVPPRYGLAMAAVAGGT